MGEIRRGGGGDRGRSGEDEVGSQWSMAVAEVGCGALLFCGGGGERLEVDVGVGREY